LVETYSDKDIFKGLKERDPKILKYIYDEFFPLIRSDIEKHYGKSSELDDIFQEAIIIAYQNIKSKKIDKNTNFKSYIWSISSNLWKNHLRKTQPELIDFSEEDNTEIIDDSLEEQYQQNIRQKIFTEHFNRLKKECKKLLKLFFKNLPIKDISKKLGYKDEAVVKSKKYKCKEHLMQSIKEDIRFKDIN